MAGYTVNLRIPRSGVMRSRSRNERTDPIEITLLEPPKLLIRPTQPPCGQPEAGHATIKVLISTNYKTAYDLSRRLPPSSFGPTGDSPRPPCLTRYGHPRKPNNRSARETGHSSPIRLWKSRRPSGSYRVLA